MKVAQLASFHFNSLIRAGVQMCRASRTAAAAEKCHAEALIVDLAFLVWNYMHFSFSEVGGELFHMLLTNTTPHKCVNTNTWCYFFSHSEFSLMLSHQRKKKQFSMWGRHFLARKHMHPIPHAQFKNWMNMRHKTFQHLKKLNHL